MQVSKIEVDNNLQETLQYVSRDFPLVIYTDEFSLFEEGYIRWHWHKYLQISYVLQDQVCFQVNGEEIILNPQEAIIFNSNVLHQIKPHNDDCKMISIMFDDSLISRNEQSLIGKKYVYTVIKSNNLNFIVLKRDIPWQMDILKYIEEAYTVYNNKEYAYELEVVNNINQIWLKIIRNLKDKIEKTNKKISYDDERVKSAINYIKENYKHEISLEDIAKSCNVSKSECCRSFKRILNITPFEYLMEYRILKASEYLYHTDESISNICMNVGFNGISYFGKVFKKYMNCTPSQYKANVRNKKNKENPIK